MTVDAEDELKNTSWMVSVQMRLKWRPDIRLTLFNVQCHWENKNAVVLSSRWIAHHQKSCTTPQMASVRLRLVKDTSAEAGETSLWMNQSACWSAQHLLDPAGTWRRAQGESGAVSHQHGFGGGHLTWRSCRTRKLQQILLCSQPWGIKRCDNGFLVEQNFTCGCGTNHIPLLLQSTSVDLTDVGRVHTSECVIRHRRSWGGLRVDEQLIMT